MPVDPLFFLWFPGWVVGLGVAIYVVIKYLITGD